MIAAGRLITLQNFAGAALAVLDRGLAEGIDSEEPRGNDGLDHEMHEKGAQRRLVEDADLHDPRRTAIGDKAVCRRPAHRRNNISEGAAIEVGKLFVVVGARRPEVDARSGPGAVGQNECEGFVGRAVEIELELAVLVDGPRARIGVVPRPPLPRLSAQSWRYQSANRDRLES